MFIVSALIRVAAIYLIYRFIKNVVKGFLESEEEKKRAQMEAARKRKSAKDDFIDADYRVVKDE